MGMGDHYRLADDITPLRSLRAGVDSQCERTREALVQALRDDVRLLTLVKLELDAGIGLGLLGDLTDS